MRRFKRDNRIVSIGVSAVANTDGFQQYVYYHWQSEHDQRLFVGQINVVM